MIVNIIDDSRDDTISYSQYGIVRNEMDTCHSPESYDEYYHTYTRILELRDSSLATDICHMNHLRCETGQSDIEQDTLYTQHTSHLRSHK